MALEGGLTIPFHGSWITTNVKNAFLIYISDLSFVASQYVDRYLVTAFLGLRLAGVYFLYWSVANAVRHVRQHCGAADPASAAYQGL